MSVNEGCTYLILPFKSKLFVMFFLHPLAILVIIVIIITDDAITLRASRGIDCGPERFCLAKPVSYILTDDLATGVCLVMVLMGFYCRASWGLGQNSHYLHCTTVHWKMPCFLSVVPVLYVMVWSEGVLGNDGWKREVFYPKKGGHSLSYQCF